MDKQGGIHAIMQVSLIGNFGFVYPKTAKRHKKQGFNRVFDENRGPERKDRENGMHRFEQLRRTGLALLLSICMMVGLLPLSALAEDDGADA